MKYTLLLILCLLVVSTASAQDSQRLLSVQSRGQLSCAVDKEVYGFGFLNPNTGGITGLQVDLCRAIAAAVLGEADAVDLRLHTLDEPLENLLADDTDVLFQHNFANNISAIAQAGLSEGTAIFFFDGASILVNSGDAISTWEDLDGQTVCVVTGSSTTADFAAQMAHRSLEADLLSFDTLAMARDAFFDGRCTAQIAQRSLLEIIRSSSDNPSDFAVWSPPFTLRPLRPLYHFGETQWGKISDAVIWGLIRAEELGISSTNFDQFLRTDGENDDDYLQRVGGAAAHLVDSDLGLGSALGLPNNFMVEAIRQVGNYGEIYDRHLGPESALSIERGLNELWSNGGLLSAPDWQ